MLCKLKTATCIPNHVISYAQVLAEFHEYSKMDVGLSQLLKAFDGLKNTAMLDFKTVVGC